MGELQGRIGEWKRKWKLLVRYLGFGVSGLSPSSVSVKGLGFGPLLRCPKNYQYLVTLVGSRVFKTVSTNSVAGLMQWGCKPSYK